MRLTKIYTRTGDKGMTRLANGQEIPKQSLRVSAYGDVDELNSILGLVLAETVDPRVRSTLVKIQHQLFDMGGELASAGDISGLIEPEMVLEIEQEIDTLNADLTPLEEFILPGGTRIAAQLHQARTVCRRAERSMLALAESESLPAVLIQFINRLSDLLFVQARFENQRSGNHEVYWQNPRKT